MFSFWGFREPDAGKSLLDVLAIEDRGEWLFRAGIAGAGSGVSASLPTL